MCAAAVLVYACGDLCVVSVINCAHINDFDLAPMHTLFRPLAFAAQPFATLTSQKMPSFSRPWTLGPGHWFDPDQLVIGNFGLSWEQARAQMALWSIWSAPLYMSNDLRSIEPEMAAILKNQKLIQVDQDPMGVFGLMTQQSADGSLQAFVKPVHPISANGCPSFAIVYLNRNSLGGRSKVSRRSHSSL